MSQFFKVFVYGTLKKGQPNHHWFLKDNGYCKFIGNAITNQKYPLIIASDYNIPFLLYSPGRGHCVSGEIYEVDEKVLASLDVLEDHPKFYVRQMEDVLWKKDAGDEISSVWIYFIKNFKEHLLERTMFDVYDSNGNHGLTYVARYLTGGDIDIRAIILNSSTET